MTTETQTQTNVENQPKITGPLSQIDVHELIKYYEIEIHGPDDLKWYMDRPYYFEQNAYQLECKKQEKRLKNQLNAMKSTGPKTAAGKRKSSRNALKHGLTAARVMLKGEAAAQFKKIEREMLADLAPVGRIEKMLADRIITLTWRLKRAEWMESAVMDAMSSTKQVKEQGNYMKKLFDDLPPKLNHMIYMALLEDCPDKFLAAVRMLPNYFAEKQEGPSQETVLGTLGLSDFGGSGVLDKLLRYQRQMESSLYKAIAELERRQYIRKRSEAQVLAQSVSDPMHDAGNKVR